MKLFASALVAGMLFVVVQDVQAFDPKRGNALWGKYAIQTWRSCHKLKGLTQLDPKERETEKWEALFANDYIKLRQMDHDFKAAGINDRQLENIYHRFSSPFQVQIGKQGIKAFIQQPEQRAFTLRKFVNQIFQSLPQLIISGNFPQCILLGSNIMQLCAWLAQGSQQDGRACRAPRIIDRFMQAQHLNQLKRRFVNNVQRTLPHKQFPR